MATSNPPASSAPGQLPRPSLSQTVDVETPELVVLSYTVAGVGSRATAAFIDYAICIATFIAVIVALLQLQVKFGVAASRDSSGAWVMADDERGDDQAADRGADGHEDLTGAGHALGEQRKYDHR
ncbi:hypothetical protein [Gemmatimonas sp.]|uniref:hypothetical protein n=1 Tax=Gemmatimonas sp. TaxID=1962908 RepID=UPI00286C1AA6|nr:hypothetical protein [Gemmatimonas sp.]